MPSNSNSWIHVFLFYEHYTAFIATDEQTMCSEAMYNPFTNQYPNRIAAATAAQAPRDAPA